MRGLDNMVTNSKYEIQMNKLLEDEKNIFYFCNLVREKVINDVQECKQIIDLVINFCEEHELDESKAWMYYYLAWYYSDKSLYNKALDLFNDAKDIFEKHDNKMGLAYAYNGLSSTYCQGGHYELSNELGLRGITIAKELKEENILITMLINTSITNIYSGSYEAAKEILDYVEVNYDYKKLGIANEVIYKKAKAEVELNIGDISKALEYIEKAIELDKTNGENICTPEVYKLLGMIHVKQGEKQKAEDEFKYSCKVANVCQSVYDYCETLIEFSKLKFNLGEDSQAIKYLDEVIKNSTELKLNRLLKSASILLYEYYKEKNKHEQALSSLELYMKADNAIHNYNNMKLIAKLNIDHGEKEMKLYKLLHDKTELLSSIGEKIISNLDIDNMVISINDEINKLMKSEFFGITVYDAEKNEVVLRTVSDGKLEIREPVNMENNTSFAVYCIKNKKTIVLDNIVKEYKKYVKIISLKDRGIKYPMSGIYIPLIINDEVIGVMAVQSLKEKAYDSNDVNALKVIGNYAAIALKNAMEYKKMEQIAIYDSLTGFLTKREIIREGNNVRTEFSKTRKSFCILMLDLDDFKNINDKYGHVVGDNVMKMVTQTISRLIRSSDYIGRYGGDEFLLVCPNITKKNALKMAERIRKAIGSTEYAVDEYTAVKTTVSIGLYEFTKDDLSFMEGVNFADLTLYRVKNKSKNKIMCFNHV